MLTLDRKQMAINTVENLIQCHQIKPEQYDKAIEFLLSDPVEDLAISLLASHILREECKEPLLWIHTEPFSSN